jgi:hypothetical protein
MKNKFPVLIEIETPMSRRIEKESDIYKEIQKQCAQYLDQPISDTLIHILKHTIKNVLYQATCDLGDPGYQHLPVHLPVHIYTGQDNECKRCGVLIWEYQSITRLDIDIGHEKRPEICDRCSCDIFNANQIKRFLS